VLSPEERDRLTVPALPRAPTWRFGVEALGSAGFTVDAAPGFAVFAARRVGVISLGAELQADGALPATPAKLQAPARIESALLAAVFAPCLHFGPAFACALGEIGWQVDKSVNIDSPASGMTTFAAAGGRIGIEVPVTRQFYLRLHADGLFNLNPVTVNVEGAEVWNQEPAAVVAGLGVGTAFL